MQKADLFKIVAHCDKTFRPDTYKDYDGAINDLTKALELKGDEALIYKFRGFAFVGLKQWDKAVADFTAAIEKNPNDRGQGSQGGQQGGGQNR